MGTVQQLTQIGFTPNQAKHLGMNGLDISYGGWIPASVVSDSEVYDVSQSALRVSATSFTVPGDITAHLQKYDKFRLTQASGTKYGYIATLSYSAGTGLTTLTIVNNDDYTIAAGETITDFWVSRSDIPLGFPGRFNYLGPLVYTGFSADPTNVVSQFYIENKTVHWDLRQATQGTSNGTGFTISPAPIVAATVTNGVWGIVCFQAFNNGAEISPPARAFIGSASGTVTLNLNTASGLWTAANGKMASWTNFTYPAT